MVYTLDTIIAFGKYRGDGLTTQEIIDDNPSYIEWAVDTIEWFELDEAATDYLYEALNSVEMFDKIDYDHWQRYRNDF